MVDFENRYSNPNMAKDYVETNKIQNPIHLRVVSLDKKSTFNTPGEAVNEQQQQFVSNLRRNIKNSTLKNDDLLFKAIEDGDGYMFRCFERRSDGKPIRIDTGFELSTIQDALKYIHEIGYEMDGTEFIQEFFASSEEPVDTYANPCLYNSDLTVIAVYRDEIYHTMEHVHHAKWEEDEGIESQPRIFFKDKVLSYKDIITYPTIRDLLEGVLIIRWI